MIAKEKATNDEEGQDHTKKKFPSDQVFFLTRRMSGKPLLEELDKSYVKLDENVLKQLNELLSKFPDPPSASDSSVTNAAPQATQKSMGWGSIRGIAERFNVFK